MTPSSAHRQVMAEYSSVEAHLAAGASAARHGDADLLECCNAALADARVRLGAARTTRDAGMSAPDCDWADCGSSAETQVSGCLQHQAGGRDGCPYTKDGCQGVWPIDLCAIHISEWRRAAARSRRNSSRMTAIAAIGGSSPLEPQIDITDAQLRELRLGAYEDEDREWVATCNRALAGDQNALEQCGRVIEGAGAPREPE